MKVLVACEFSGVVRDAYSRRGHDAWSCDLLPTERPGNHIIGDARSVLGGGWDLLIAHPPCTDLAVSGARWMKEKGEARIRKSLELFLAFINAPVHMICVENPIGIISRLVREPDQIIQPWKFGHGETKATCLWLKNLPPLRPTKIVRERAADMESAAGAGSVEDQEPDLRGGRGGNGEAVGPDQDGRVWPLPGSQNQG